MRTLPRETAHTATENWVSQFLEADEDHKQKIKSLREAALYDESMPVLDRAVLGLSGSIETLKRYNQLAKKVGELAGKPLIVINRIRTVEPKHVMQASAGIMTGEVAVKIAWPYPNSVHEEDRNFISGAKIYIITKPGFGYT